MKISHGKGSGSKVVLLMQPSDDELARLKTHVLGHFRPSVKVPGFREGTAPPAIIEKNIDQQTLTDEFLNHAVNEFYRKAIEAKNLRPVGQPKITIKKFVPYTALEIEAEFDTIGQVALPDYKKMKVAKKKISVSAKDIEAVLAQLRERTAGRQPVDRPAKLGDELTIDFDGYDKSGKAISGASSKRYALVLGSQAFIPGFEDKLVGAKAGQDLEFKIKFPADYHMPALANQDVEFKIKVHSVNEISDAKMDKDFLAKTGPFKSLAELKADIKKQLTAERETQNTRDYENEVVKRIVKKSKLTVPASLVDEEIERMESDEKRDLSFRGQTWEEHLKEEGLNEEKHRERQRPVATERVRGGLVLSEIAEREKIQVSNEEVDERIDQLRAEYKDEQMRAELDNPENRNDIVSRLLTEKTLAKLIAYVSKK